MQCLNWSWLFSLFHHRKPLDLVKSSKYFLHSFRFRPNKCGHTSRTATPWKERFGERFIHKHSLFWVDIIQIRRDRRMSLINGMTAFQNWGLRSMPHSLRRRVSTFSRYKFYKGWKISTIQHVPNHLIKFRGKNRSSSGEAALLLVSQIWFLSP